MMRKVLRKSCPRSEQYFPITLMVRFRYVLSKISSNVVETILPWVSLVCRVKSEQELVDAEAILHLRVTNKSN